MENTYITCPHCGRELRSEEDLFYTESIGIGCEDCVASCDCCGNYCFLDDLEEVAGNEQVCYDCYQNHYVECDACHEHVLRRSVNTFLDLDRNEVDICEDCEGDNTFRCENCREIIFDPNDDAHSDADGNRYCNVCYSYMAEQHIHPYSFKPSPVFFPDRDNDIPYFGIELEVDSRSSARSSDLEDIAGDVEDIFDGYVYIKHDSSLRNGMELVTHPSTVHYHTVEMEKAWKKAIKLMLGEGLLSNDIKTCGLHVHVSLDAIERRDPAIVGKIMVAMNMFWPKFVKFSRRTDEQLSHWARRYACDKPDNENHLRILKNIAKGECGRYMALNLQNRHTIEFRLFNGTLRWETFVATIQFVETIIDNLSNMSFKEIQEMTWERITRSEYPELKAYLVRRGLAGEKRAEEESDQPEDQQTSGEMGEEIRIGDRVRIRSGNNLSNEASRVIIEDANNDTIRVAALTGREEVLLEFANFHSFAHGGPESGRANLGIGHYWWVTRDDLEIIQLAVGDFVTIREGEVSVEAQSVRDKLNDSPDTISIVRFDRDYALCEFALFHNGFHEGRTNVRYPRGYGHYYWIKTSDLQYA